MFIYDQIKKDAEEMEVDLAWALGRRKDYLYSKMILKIKEIQSISSCIEGKNSLTKSMGSIWIGKCRDEIEKLEREISCLNPCNKNSCNWVTREMIGIAERYPIKNLLHKPIVKGMTNCVAHEDKNPSMSVNFDYVFCHSCGFHANTIKLYKHMSGVSFPTAVKELMKFSGR